MTDMLFASWHRVTGTLTPEAEIRAALGEYTYDYDLEALERDYRQAINAALPDGMHLEGDEFLVHVDMRGQHDADAVTELVNAVPFWKLAEKHEKADAEPPSETSASTLAIVDDAQRGDSLVAEALPADTVYKVDDAGTPARIALHVDGTPTFLTSDEADLLFNFLRAHRARR